MCHSADYFHDTINPFSSVVSNLSTKSAWFLAEKFRILEKAGSLNLHSTLTQRRDISLRKLRTLCAPPPKDVASGYMPQRFSQAHPKTPSNSAPPTPNTTPHVNVTLTHAKALPISNSSASAASNRAAFQPLPPPTAIDRAALSLFSPEHSPLNTPPTTPATTPMIELHLNDQPSFTSLDNSGIPPSNLRQQLLRRTLPKTASAEEENKVTRTAAQTTKETGLEPWPLVQGPLVFRTLWWCVYALLFTFYVVAGEILPAIQEGVLRASRVFLHVPAPVKEEKDGEPSG